MPMTEQPDVAQTQMLEYVQSGVIVHGPDARVLYANESACALLGLPLEQLVGKDASAAGWPLPWGDGGPLPPEVHPVNLALATGQPVLDVALAFERRTTGERTWALASARPDKAPDGRVQRVVLTLVDVSELMQRVTELETAAEAGQATLRHQLVQAQRMETAGQLAGGVAHDFNNILMVMKGYCELMRLAAAGNESILSALAQIEAHADRAVDLTRQLLAFSRGQNLNPVVIDLNNLMTDMEHMLQRVVGENIQLAMSLSPHPAMVTADRTQIEQVLVNLAMNARDFMPRGGKLGVRISWVDVDEISPDDDSSFTPGTYVSLSVSDTGQGMDAETRRRIFEPFFSVRGEGKGMGLGLSTVYGVIHQSGGTIRVESELGKGTTFNILLPRVEVTLPRRGDGPPVAMGVDAKTVLVVEDEAALRGLVVMMLERLGYAVREASNGPDALSLLEAERLKPEVLLTDVVMPEMSGSDLAAKVRERLPGVKVIFMSGYADETILDHGVSDPSFEFLRKPFSMADLEAHLDSVLGVNT
jgi:two-component system, cell cycle sensor histidine kinase and response regulator CckA